MYNILILPNNISKNDGKLVILRKDMNGTFLFTESRNLSKQTSANSVENKVAR